MPSINVTFKQLLPNRPDGTSVALSATSKVELVKAFPFKAKFAAFAETSKAGLSAEKSNQAFYAALTPEEQFFDRTYTTEVANDAEAEKLVAAFKKLPNVEFAAVNRLYELHFVPNDPLYNNLWAMPKIKADLAWNISKGNGVVVAVCDTGVDPTHPDIFGNLWNDGSGHFGYDFSDHDNNPSDYHGHGTHVAGTIAASGNNSTGVVGVAFQAKIMAVKIFPNAYPNNIVPALMYAADRGAKIINCSWGPNTKLPVADDPYVRNAIDYAFNKGCYCVFSAGNNNIDCTTQFPANYSKVITVGSTNTADGKSGFSNWGTAVDVAAPGENIQSLQMGGAYSWKSGTSMSAPHVSGAAALLFALAPRLSFANLRYFLQKSADPITTTPTISGKRLNCYKLVAPAIQTYKRQTNVETTNGRYALQTTGKIAHLNWTGGAWVQNVIPVWGPPVLAGSMIDMGGGRVAAVNAAGNMVNTYGGTPLIPNYAPIHETFGLVAGTLRFCVPRSAYFALNVFNDFVYIKWVNNQWNMDVIPCYAGPTVASSVELAVDNIMATNIYGVMGHTWNDANGQVLSDGSKISFNQIGVSSNLIP
jgi:thermitase